jgi:hypothetical protein
MKYTKTTREVTYSCLLDDWSCLLDQEITDSFKYTWQYGNELVGQEKTTFAIHS